MNKILISSVLLLSGCAAACNSAPQTSCQIMNGQQVCSTGINMGARVSCGLYNLFLAEDDEVIPTQNNSQSMINNTSNITDSPNKKEEFCSGFTEGFKSINGPLRVVPPCPNSFAMIMPGKDYYQEGIKAGVQAAGKKRF